MGIDEKFMMSLVIYGAKSLALGMYYAIRELYPEYSIRYFLVTSLKNNPHTLAGLPVKEIKKFSYEVKKDKVHILIATPEDLHEEIIQQLEQYGFFCYTCMNSFRESVLMEKYFFKIGKFPSIHNLRVAKGKASLKVFMAKFYKDKPLKKTYKIPSWVDLLQVGSELTEVRVAELQDNIEMHISAKNPNYCELTALYWIWKNILINKSNMEYYGLFHYRRILDIKDMDLYRINEKDVDVILQFPTLHEPDIGEHHARYVKESDWEAMLQALQELQPEYAKELPQIFRQPYFYNYNLIIAKKRILANYCEWLFPILERIEMLSEPKGWERKDRYIGYLGENLMTLYFLYHQKDLKIYHTGRLMLT